MTNSLPAGCSDSPRAAMLFVALPADGRACQPDYTTRPVILLDDYRPFFKALWEANIRTVAEEGCHIIRVNESWIEFGMTAGRTK